MGKFAPQRNQRRWAKGLKYLQRYACYCYLPRAGLLDELGVGRWGCGERSGLAPAVTSRVLIGGE